ncbi:MAG: PBP1A family penicillin-binding protein [Candidatus Pelagibacter bacterium]|nr:PBP1A family penicillin-binding protein [Candidatus Pelagibacter bacterium]MBL6860899.1 PBP1A family penicillin-binding protein [Candidatus Pelagibacter bacterium]
MLKFLNFSTKFIITFTAVVIFFIFSTLWYFSIGLPDYKKLSNYQPPISSRVYSENNKLIAEYAVEKRLFIPFDSIPDKVVNSFLSAEDKNFFNHPGIDAKGILRAVIKNIKNISQNKRLEGASTITQQVAKNFLLTNEVSIKRKIKEAILAFRIERAYTKERILELYLNQIYLGQGTYGIAAASLEYFDKSIKELNYAEAALLAALPKAPSKYNPYKYPDVAKFRRNLVLENLKENNFISKEKLIVLKGSNLKLKKRKIEIVNEANSYTEEVRRTVKNIYGFEKLYSQGLSISTPLKIDYQIQALKSLRKGIENYDRRQGWRGPITNKIKKKNWKKKVDQYILDPTLNWQLVEIISSDDNEIKFKAIDKSENKGVLLFKNLKWTIPKNKTIKDIHKAGDIIFVKKEKDFWSIKQYPKVNGGIVIIEPYTGDILALVGGFNFKKSEFNRVTQAKRQPGSAFKPIVYAAALEKGFAPNSIILDAPFVESQGVGLKNWKPENYGKKFYGPSTFRKGIEYSRNLMTVRIAKILGLNEILNLSKKLNIYQEIPELLSVSLGAAETTLLSLTSAYAPFVNGGKKVEPKLISRIQDRRGKTIFQNKNIKCLGCDKFINNETEFPKIENKNERVLSEETAYQMTSILQGAVERGTAKRLRTLKVPLAGKTGTTNDNYDAWFIGFSSNLVIGVYIGYDNPKTLGKFETGSKTALPIFKDFVENALYKEDFNEFQIPENIYLTSLNYDTGAKSAAGEKNSITEALKLKDINNLANNNLISPAGHDKIIKFRQFY